MAARVHELKAARAGAHEQFERLLAAHLDAAKADSRGFSAEEKTAQAEAEAKVKNLDELVSAEEKRIEIEKARAANGPARIEVGADHTTEKPWHGKGEPAAVGFGRWLQAVRRASSGEGADPRLFAVATGMGETSGPDGGWAVPVEYAPGIEKEMWDSGQILSRVSDRPIGGNAISYNVLNETARTAGNRRGGVLGYWVDEGTAPTASSIKLAKVEMKLRKVAALGYMTDELEADAPALAGELQAAFAEELQFMVEDAIVEGSGVGSPLGILNAPCLVTVAKEVGQAAATIVTPNLSKMWARLPARSQANAVWFVNVDCQPQLDELSIATGAGALEPRFVNYGPDGILRIKGRPVVPIEYASTLGTVGDIGLFDLTRYRLIRKAAGVETASSIHVRFTQGENTYRATYRVDGQPLPRAAITPLKGTNTLSPFVVLATRA
jgi:HK97 family phage major capsid protein